MNLNKKELKKVIYDFNSISNRLMKVDYNEYLSVLKIFLIHIESCEVIFDYINDCGASTFDIASEVASVAASYGRAYFDLGISEKEETANVYHLLKYIADKNMNIHLGLAWAYSTGSTKYQDKIKGFNERVVLVLIRYIEGYLTKIGIDMGLDESVKYSITVNNGQVNVANDNAVINATQSISMDNAELNKLLATIKSLLCELPNEERETIEESIEVIEVETLSDKPRKSMIRTALTTIYSLNLGAIATTELLTNIEALSIALQSFIV